MTPYHYKECGLPNVLLKNGFEIKKTPYGKGVSIHDVKGLHSAIALFLVEKHGPLTASELRFLRLELDMSQKRLGELLGREEQTVSLWERQGKIPSEVDFVVRHIFKQFMGDHQSYVDLVDQLRAKDRDEHISSVCLEKHKNTWCATAA